MPAKELDALKQALPKVETNFVRMRATMFFAPVPIVPSHDVLVRLRREKFNAAVAGVKAGAEFVSMRNFGDPSFMELVRKYRDAALDLDDANMKKNAIDQCAHLLRLVKDNLEQQDQAGTADPQAVRLAQYAYLDIQIVQLRLKRQMDASSP